MTPQTALKKFFGHTEFRENQLEVIENVNRKQDTLMVVSTGSGKSLCYQLPGMMGMGMTIVISPLISLMQDQVESLRRKGIQAELIASYMTPNEAWDIKSRAESGEIKFLFVSPERVVTEKFIGFMNNLDIDIFAIDEAHCLSQWGGDFRPSYMELGKLKVNFPDSCICAFTASATNKVKKDIVSNLNMDTPEIISGSTFRDNIEITVEERQSKGYPRLIKLIKKYNGGSGVIYAFSRKDVERIATELKRRRVGKTPLKVAAYHAGMTDKARKKVLDGFMSNEINIVVATVAFGMGIDKPDIRFVCHMHIPRSMEGYYQEIGRAGRDSKPSEALLLYSYGDIKKIEYIIENNDIGKQKVENLLQIDIMREYAFTYKCRHRIMANHFQDKIGDCKVVCDNCKENIKL